MISQRSRNRGGCIITVPHVTFRVCTILALLAICAPAAHADWIFSHYRGDTRTRSNDVKITRPDGQAGANLTLSGVDYDGAGWDKPVYYGYRLSRFFDSRPHIGIELEMTHAKAIADIGQTVGVNGTNVLLSTVMQRLELSHGLNFALANVVVRRPAGRRLLLVGRAGGGVTVPHVETVFEGVRKNGYQYGGRAWQIAGGIEYRLIAGLQAIADVRLTTAYENVLVGPTGSDGPKLSGPFMSGHFGVGLGYRLGKTPW